MIKKIDIKKFGCFSDFDWSAVPREGQAPTECKRLNILYGRNYSGKTTLSRVLRSFEVGRLPENFRNPEFCLTTDEEVLSQADVNGHMLDIRVYNTDFVDENLSFLKDHAEGEVKTFAILGSENKEIEQQIEVKEALLGNAEAKVGLRYELAERQKDFKSKEESATQADQALEEKLRRYANDVIKHDKSFGDPSYNIASIKGDIATVGEETFSILDENEVLRLQDILKEEALPDIEENVSFQPAFSVVLENAEKVLRREIKPTAPIQDLLYDAALQFWVRSGMDHHREKRSTCGFCGQALPADLWEKLDAHFIQESSELEEELIRQVSAIEDEINAGSTIVLPERESLYISERPSFESQRGDFHDAMQTYQADLRKIMEQIQARQTDIFTAREAPDVSDVSRDLQANIEAINELIKRNNSIAETLPRQQLSARDALRKDAVAKFIRDIGLSKERNKLSKLMDEVGAGKTKIDELTKSVQKVEEEIEDLRTRLQDEKKGAEKVNEYLNHHFGHEGLHLEAVEDLTESKFKFQIMRGGEPAYNMSEGECSLVAFCYFIARLEDIETQGKDLVIYIDDPASSLDSNHIFFVFSLIESAISYPDKNEDGSLTFRYRQLFISTHNLDFFKYLIRIKLPKPAQGGSEFFLIEKEGGRSTIRLMPRYLKDYQTEFHYLFHQIYRCKDGQHAHENHEVFYNFGNNLRKFLEAYLFYKYPYKNDQTNTSDRLLKFFGEDATATVLTNRISNELSHLEQIFGRSMRPIDIPEIPKVANFVLDKMYEKDGDQFNALLKSIGESERQD